MSKSDGTAKSNFGKKGWVILILAFFSILLMSLIVYDSLNVTIPAFAAQKGWNMAILYIFSTIAAWISVIGAALWGGICSKKTNRFGWVAALLLGAVGCVVWAFAGSPVVYLISLALAMVGGMGFAYIANLNVINNWFPTKKGLVMGWVTIGFPLSATIAVPVCSGLLGGLGLQGIYFVFAGLCVVLALLVAILVRDYPEQSGAFPDNNKSFDKEHAAKELQAGLDYMKTSPWNGKAVFKSKETKKIVFSLGVMELLALGIMTNYVPRMMQIGYAEEQIIPLLVIAGVVAMFGSYLCGVLDAHVGPKKAIWITYLFGIFSLILNLVGGALKLNGMDKIAFIMIIAAQPFLGVMLGGAANYLVSLTATIWGRYDFPAAYRVLKPLVAIVGALGISICGVLGNTVGYAYAYLFFAVLAVIATFVDIKIDDTYVGRK